MKSFFGRGVSIKVISRLRKLTKGSGVIPGAISVFLQLSSSRMPDARYKMRMIRTAFVFTKSFHVN